MTEIGDVIVTLLTSLMPAQAVLAVTVLFGMITTVLATITDALTQLFVSSTSVAIPQLAFEPSQVRIASGAIVIPTELMYIVCTSSALSFYREQTRNKNPLSSAIIAAGWGLFVPILAVHVMNLLIYNANRIIGPLSEGLQNFATNMPLGVEWRALFLSSLIAVVYREAGFPALFSMLFLGLFGGLATVAVYVLRLLFAIYALLLSILVMWVALRALAAANFRAIARVISFLLLVTMLLAILSAATSVAVDLIGGGYIYSAAVLAHYRGNLILGSLIDSYLTDLSTALGEENGQKLNTLVNEQEKDACASPDRTCSQLLSQQVLYLIVASGIAAGGVVLLVIVAAPKTLAEMRGFHTQDE